VVQVESEEKGRACGLCILGSLVVDVTKPLLQLAWCFHGLTYTDGTRPDWQMAMASFRGMLTVPSHL